MNILVINISLRPQSLIKHFPIGLGYITTAMNRAGFAFDLLDIDGCRYSDSEIEERIKEKKYDVVCMGCIVTGYKIVKSLTSLVRKHQPNSIIIVGNTVASSVAEILLTCTETDIAVMGEGDETIIDILSAIKYSRPFEEVMGICFKKDGLMIRTPFRPFFKNISDIPFIDYSIFDVEEYIKTSKEEMKEPLPFPREKVRSLPINTARGCISNCGFCYHAFKGIPYRFRSPESIIKEIKEMIYKYNLNHISFCDELTFFSKKQVRAFVNKIFEEDIHFYWDADCRGNLFQEEEDISLIKDMKKVGCLGLIYSLESSDTEILKAMNKRITVEQFSRQTKLLQKGGLATWTSIVLGYPQETPETIRKTFDCCIENKIYPSAGYLLPQPGSSVYTYAVEKGYITHGEDYLMMMGDRQDLLINLTSMTDEELVYHVVQGLDRANKELKVGLSAEKLIKTQYSRVVSS